MNIFDEGRARRRTVTHPQFFAVRAITSLEQHLVAPQRDEILRKRAVTSRINIFDAGRARRRTVTHPEFFAVRDVISTEQHLVAPQRGEISRK